MKQQTKRKKKSKSKPKSRVVELGKIIVEIICLTHWKLNYILDDITLDQAMLIHKYGIGFEETKSIILLNQYAQALSGKSKNEDIGDKPDMKKFRAIYGNRIKTNKKDKL